MPRVHARPVPKIALTATKLAAALGVRYDRVIMPAIDDGALPVYRIGNKGLILVSDVERWVRSFPLVKRRKRKVSHD
jgi:hypothetical protein